MTKYLQARAGVSGVVAVSAVFLLGACSLVPSLLPGKAPVSEIPLSAPTIRLEGSTVVASTDSFGTTIDTETLAAKVTTASGEWMTVSAPTTTDLGNSTTPTVSAGGEVSWEYPTTGVSATLSPDDATGGVRVLFRGTVGRDIDWPVTSTDGTVRGVQYANGSGQDIPVRDAFWNAPAAGLTAEPFDFAGDLTLPAWGVTANDDGLGAAFSTSTDIDTRLGFASEAGTLVATSTHDFTDEEPHYEVVVSPTNGNPVGAATAYRQAIIAQSDFVTLDEKITANPVVGNLIGAPHAYVWGTGREVKMIAAMQDADLTGLWIGYDSDGDVPSSDFVAAGTRAGYLVAPYDSWANAQDPATSDTPASTWPGLYPEGCVQGPDGEQVPGFGGRGCYLSSAALRKAEEDRGVITDRVQALTQNGARSYFLDVDAAGQLFTDTSADHPQTRHEDRAIRLERMRQLTDGTYGGGQRLVVGSESAAAWAASSIAFSHGSSTSVYPDLWAAQADAESWGAYWPKDRPGFFFRPTTLDTDLSRAMFDPVYRIPMYETALHDSVISTDRWELSAEKVPDARFDRTLTALLYNEPLMHTLDAERVAAEADALAAEQAFFAFIQRAAGTKPLTGFQRLTDQGLVQRTAFGGDALVLTANFGAVENYGVAPGCIKAVVKDDDDATFCAPSA